MAGRIEAALARTSPDADVYAFSLWVCTVEDDPRVPCVWFGSNSERQVQASLGLASDPVEARWNFAFWEQNEIEVFGGEDLRGAGVFRDWLECDLQCWFTGEDDVRDPEEADRIGRQMESAFFRKMADVVAVLHDRGGTLGPSGQRVPIIVHRLEYSDETAFQNELANPAEVLPVEFLRFCRGLSPES